ncbi:MAG: phage terminase large subunit [Alphaproteobacteria bacterium]|nr:phage terminase large subunit [Alphaproteobacteria bacterium]
MRDQDASKIKSLEGADICWIEEGQSITKKSWNILDPTIRKEGSEIWISMNRENENDALWMILGKHPDKRTLVQKVNFMDNPFCPEEIKFQAQKCLKDRPEEYPHIWLGEPKSQADKTLISSGLILKAFQTKGILSKSPLVIGVDIARFGSDKSAFVYRKGRSCFKYELLSSQDTVDIANRLTALIYEVHPHKIFLDLGNSGAGVYDILNDRGFSEIVVGINFGAKAIQKDRYVNKRAEMWDGIRLWLSGKLPVELLEHEGVLSDLISVQKKYDSYGRLQLESKDELKKRLGHSPDIGDALALTFAEPVFEKTPPKLYKSGVSFEDLFQEEKLDLSW